MGNPTDPRLDALRRWLPTLPDEHRADLATLRPASADASFRRYFRVDTPSGTRIIMDAPPEREPLTAFLEVGQRLRAAQLRVPDVLASAPEQGFLLLSDLGTQTYYDALHPESGERLADATLHRWYLAAIDTLVQLQQGDAAGLPVYDGDRLTQELQLFDTWYLRRHHDYTPTAQESAQLAAIYARLAERAAAQPKVLVHRDFHSPNLMVPQGDDPRPGVIDFQDAVCGPLAYDVVSLLMDARTTWDEAQQLDWGIRYWQAARRAGLPVPADIADFHTDWEWLGLQRNLRILGVFARLHHRDGKSHYLAHLPRVENYVRQVAGHFDVFRPLLRLLNQLEANRTTPPAGQPT